MLVNIFESLCPFWTSAQFVFLYHRENLSTGHSLVEAQAKDVPSTGNDAVWVNHGHRVTDRGGIGVLSGDGICPQAGSRGTEDGSDEIRLLNALTCQTML